MSDHGFRAVFLRCAAVCLLLIGVAAVGTSPVSASDDRVVRRGSCSGPSDWKIDVRKEDGGRLRVKYEVEDGRPDQKWHVFISDNGVGIFAGTRISGANGHFEVSKYTANRPGDDRIRTGSNNTVTGETCNGRARI